MKSIISLFLTIVVIVAGNSCAHAQNDDAAGRSKIMLREFYTVRSTLKLTAKDHHRLDSLQKKYCTVKLRNQLKADFQANGLDHDLLTLDNGIDAESVNTIVVKNAPLKVADYIVTYIVSTVDFSNNPIKKRVTLHLTVAKENGTYKIDSVN